MLRKLDKNELAICVGGFFLFLAILFISPIADDWTYLASPAANVLSLAHYRRLADVLLGMLLQSRPGWFPHLNRILIVASHTVCAIMLYKTSTRFLDVKPCVSLVFSLLFLIGGNTIATVLNYDCFNQTGSLMLGAIGIYCFLKAESNLRKYIFYFVFCILALCVKESGMVFFAIIPLMGVIKNTQSGKFSFRCELVTIIKFCIPGFLFAALYYFSPIFQTQQLWVYGSGFTWGDYVVGIGRRLVFSYSQIDQTAIIELIRGGSFNVESILVLLCTLLSIPLIIVSVHSIIKLIKAKNVNAITIAVLAACSIIVFTPTLIASAFGSIWSQNHIVYFASLTFCCILKSMNGKRVLVSVSCFVLASTITASCVYYQYSQTGMRQANAVHAIESQLVSRDIYKYLVINLNVQRGPPSSYPSRLHSIPQIFDSGSTMRFFLGYDASCTYINLSNEDYSYSGIAPQSTKLDMTDEELLLHARQEAEKAVESGGYDLAIVVLPTDVFYLYQPT